MEEGLETGAATGTRVGLAGHEARAELTLWAPRPKRTAWAPGTERALERTVWARIRNETPQMAT